MVKTSTEEVEFIYKVQNHKFVSEGFTVCSLSLNPQKQTKSKNATAQNTVSSDSVSGRKNVH